MAGKYANLPYAVAGLLVISLTVSIKFSRLSMTAMAVMVPYWNETNSKPHVIAPCFIFSKQVFI
jgi:hypothetical protein